jgi:uncharacterized membrane protein YphA (DoxX/SURF4 family)
MVITKCGAGFIITWISWARSAFLNGWPIFCAGTEFFGGIAIVLGLFTRFFAAAFIIEMAVAIWKIHFKNGLMGNGGYEFPLAMATIAFGLLCFGGGPWGATFGKSEGWKAR